MSPMIAPDVMPYLSRDRQSAQLSSKKKQSPLTIILLLAILALVAVGIARLVAKPAAPDTVKVVGVAQDLPPGCRLGFHTLHYITIPRAYFKPHMFESYDQVVGRVTRTYVGMGEPLSKSALFHSPQGLAKQVMGPERALTLKLPSDALLDHNIYPGDRVDVIVTSSANGGKKYTKTVCQNIRVLMCTPKEAFLSSKMRAEEQEKVTLAFLPADAEKIAEAIECGKIRLALRNPSNQTELALPGADERDLLPAEALKFGADNKPVSLPPPPASAPAPAPAANAMLFPPIPALPQTPVQWLVEVFSGSKKETQAFDAK